MGLLDDAIREHLDLKRRRGADPTDIERAEREALGPVRREPAGAALEELTSSPAAPVPNAGAPQPHDLLDDDDWDAPRDVPEEGGLLIEGDPIDVDDRAAEDATAILEPAPAEPRAAAEPPPAAEPPSPPTPISAGEPSGIAAPGYADPEFDTHSISKPRRRGLFHRRSEPQPAPEVPAEQPAVRRIDRSQPLTPPPVDSDPFVEDDGAFEPPAPAGAAPTADPPSLQIGGEGHQGHTVEYDVEKAFREEDEEGDEDILEETPDFLADTPDHDRLWFEQKPPPDFDFDA